MKSALNLSLHCHFETTRPALVPHHIASYVYMPNALCQLPSIRRGTTCLRRTQWMKGSWQERDQLIDPTTSLDHWKTHPTQHWPGPPKPSQPRRAPLKNMARPREQFHIVYIAAGFTPCSCLEVWARTWAGPRLVYLPNRLIPSTP